MQPNTIKLLSCLTSWEELFYRFKKLSSTLVTWFQLEFCFNVHTVKSLEFGEELKGPFCK